MIRRIALIVSAMITAISISACGASWNAAHNHNAPTPTGGDQPAWHWLRSPGSFQTIIYACIGTEGYYETQDNSYPIVIVPQDPLCGFRGLVTNRPIH